MELNPPHFAGPYCPTIITPLSAFVGLKFTHLKFSRMETLVGLLLDRETRMKACPPWDLPRIPSCQRCNNYLELISVLGQ